MYAVRVEDFGFQSKKENFPGMAQEPQPSFGELDNNRDNSVSKTAERVKFKKDLSRAMAKHQAQFPECRKLSSALDKCSLSLQNNNGSLKFDFRLCRNKACPFRSPQRLTEEQDVLGYFIKEALDQGKKYGMLTLTIPHKKESSAKQVLAYLQGTWARFNSDKKVQTLFEGAFKNTEWTIGSKGFHYHYHLLLVVPDNVSWTAAKRMIEQRWKRVGGGFIRMNRYDQLHKVNPAGIKNAIMEMTSYVGKQNKKYGMKKMVEVLAANYRKRFFSYLGTWSKDKLKAVRALVKEKRAAAMRDLDIETPPLPYDEETGEVYEIPNDKVDPHTAAVKARLGNPGYVWLRDYLEWCARWFRHPEFEREHYKIVRWKAETFQEEMNAQRFRKLFTNDQMNDDFFQSSVPF